MSANDQASALEKLREGKRVTWIAEAYNLPRAIVIQLGLDNGLTHNAHADIMQARHTPPQVERSRSLLTQTETFKDATVQRLRKRILDTLEALRQRVEEVGEIEAARQRAEAAKQELLTRKAKLRAELAAIDQQLRPARAASTPKTATPAPTGPTPGEIRAWAVANNVPCSVHGRVPESARDAYLQAHPHERTPAA